MSYSECVKSVILHSGDGECQPYPELMTEKELIEYLRIPEVSRAKDYHNVINNLKRFHGLPRIHICGQPLYPRKEIDKWIEQRTGRRK